MARLSNDESRNRSHLMVMLAGIALFATPVILCVYLLLPLQEMRKEQHEIVRHQPGQTVLLVEEQGNFHEETKAVLAVETLNRGLALLALRDPLLANLLPTKTEAEVAQLLRELSPAMEKTLKDAYHYRTAWKPSTPPWGMFLLPNDKPPESGIPFGVARFEGGVDKTRIATETTLNRLNSELKIQSVLKVLQAALATQSIDENNAVNLLAGTEVLGIKFRAEHNLFLSDKSLAEWEATKALLEP